MADGVARPSPAEIYERAFVPAVFEPLTRVVLERARPAPGEDVLDLACGTGIVARHVARLVGPEGGVTGVDLRPGMIAVAEAVGTGSGDESGAGSAAVTWLVGDAERLELPSSSFDLVVCQQGIQFFADRVGALREVRRVLRPGGRLVAAVWRGVSEQGLLGALVDVELRHLGPLGLTYDDAAAPFLMSSGEELAAVAASAGLVDVAVDVAGIQTAFAADTFVVDVEYAYSGLFPQFTEDPTRFEAFVAAVERETRDVVARYRVGDRLVSPMRTHLLTAVAPG
jgi:SAM-dependent methyltransferase